MKPKFSAFFGKQEIKDKYMADMADNTRVKFIELIKESV